MIKKVQFAAQFYIYFLVRNELESKCLWMKIPSLLLHVSEAFIHEFEFHVGVFVNIALGSIEDVTDVFVRDVVRVFQEDADY